MKRISFYVLYPVVLTACLTALLFTTPTASAAQFSGGYLLEICEIGTGGREEVPGGHTACQSYISGVIDYHNMLQSMGLAPDIRICIPAGTTLYELHVAVLNYLRGNTQHDAFTAAPAVTTALHEKYPCPDK